MKKMFCFLIVLVGVMITILARDYIPVVSQESLLIKGFNDWKTWNDGGRSMEDLISLSNNQLDSINRVDLDQKLEMFRKNFIAINGMDTLYQFLFDICLAKKDTEATKVFGLWYLDQREHDEDWNLQEDIFDFYKKSVDPKIRSFLSHFRVSRCVKK